jgi:hypothetical protein
MKNKVTLIIILITSLSVLTISSAQSTANPGVQNEDVFEYNYLVTWNSTNSAASTPSFYTQLNKTQSFQIKITNVSGTTVNANVTSRYRDGTSNSETGFVNVQSGSIRLAYGFLITPANLSINDKIYPSGGDATINGTVTRTYQTGDRQTNQYTVEISSENHYEKTEIYFDKIKGIAVSSYYLSIDTFGSETETFQEIITNTNSDVWTAAPPSPTPTPSATPSATSTPSASVTPAPSSVIPELPVFVVPLVLFASAASLLMVKTAKRFSR